MKSLQVPKTDQDVPMETDLSSTNTQFQSLDLNEEEFDDLSQLQPLPSQMYSLWQVFLERVHPLTMVIHAPTMNAHLVDAICGTSSLPKSIQALLFSIFGLAMLSLTEEEAWNMVGTDKENALARFAMGLRMALSRAKFLEFPNLTVLQALTLYLVRRYLLEERSGELTNIRTDVPPRSPRVARDVGSKRHLPENGAQNRPAPRRRDARPDAL